MLLALPLSRLPLAVPATLQEAIIVAITVIVRRPESREIPHLHMPAVAIVLGSLEMPIEGIAVRLRHVPDRSRARTETFVTRLQETSTRGLPARFHVRLLLRLLLHSGIVRQRHLSHNHDPASRVEEAALTGMLEIVAATSFVMTDRPFELEADLRVLFADRMILTGPVSTGRMTEGQIHETIIPPSDVTYEIDRYETCHQSQPVTLDPAVAQTPLR